MRGIADTGFLVAFANRADEHHGWALALAQMIEEPLLSCEAVIAETIFHLGNAAVVMKMMETGLFRLDFDAKSHLPELKALALKYADRRPDFADLCLIRMSELNPKLPVITVDGDFKVYRRNKRELIPLISPER